LMPEEFDQIAQFIDRVERKISSRLKPAVKKAVDTVTVQIRSELPDYLFEKSIIDSGLPEHVTYILQEAGYASLGDLVLQVKKDPDEILKLQGIGPRAMTEINHLMDEVMPIIEKINATAQAEKEQETETEAVVEQEEEPLLEETAVETAEISTVAITEDEAVPAEEPSQEVVVEPVTVSLEQEEPETAETVVEEVPEEEPSFDELFSLKAQDIPETEFDEDEEEGEVTTDEVGKKKKKKKKKKSREVEFDPEANAFVVKKKHKTGDGGWDWDI